MVEEFPYLPGAAGAAFVLDRPADISVIMEHPDGSVTERQGAPYATVALKATQDVESARAAAWRVLSVVATGVLAIEPAQSSGMNLSRGDIYCNAV